ncbi:CocE/NonD family hydrolase [Actinomadura algeriensis]|uniref:CocE/NonD family hydrolase n=1 Tax=Actinomadura algeriensis TaxID=1679523 RepID=A0ABR9JRF6_9ACTN|nr:CocE/NonD family hydrolase [Actinomadura algeriensis]MBE1533153.1 putative CocE/NonD family hydrolase [Actinomadura algeriensis]
MRSVTALPNAIREDEHVWIPMSDGVRLAARIWRPVSSDDEPVPVVLEFIPYRKRDLTAQRDSVHHPYMAGHGYACVRVDLRGTGDSEGVLTDEYLERELRDAEEILAWLAAQPWSTGRSGMMGISWGGFNALQVAARRPPGLDAIVPLCFSDDRYADDVHYMGGCLLSDNLSWASTMFAYTSCPPDPAVVGERWREMWHERLEGSGLWLAEWLRHQRRDEYWRHASVCEDYAAVECPVLAVSGWADGYSNAVFRVLEHLDVPRQGLVGPWSHKYPHIGEPGPAIGFLQEVVRWWDRWLKDVDNGVMDEPMLRIWMQDSVPPSTSYAERPGRWVGETSWPSPRVDVRARPLERNRIAQAGEDVGKEELTIESPLSVGQFAGKWCSYNAPPDLPYDQREEDGGSLVFDSEPFAERCELLGSPVVRLELAADRPQAMVAVRLSDVAPDGRATRVSYGLLNLTHRDGHDSPEPLRPGERYEIAVPMNAMAQAFPPGHRVRLSISTSYWPLAWPPPRPARLSIFTGASALELPVRPVGAPGEPDVAGFAEPEGTPPLATSRIRPGEEAWRVSRDLVGYESKLEVVKDLGVVRFDDIDLEVSRRADETYGWTGDDFTSVFGDVEWNMGFARGDWAVATVTRTKLTSTETDFHVHARLDAFEGDHRVASRNWTIAIPRDQL